MEWAQIHIPKCKKKSHSKAMKESFWPRLALWMRPFICILGSHWSTKDLSFRDWAWFQCASRIVDWHYFDNPKCTFCYQDLFIKCLISQLNIGYWQLITCTTQLFQKEREKVHPWEVPFFSSSEKGFWSSRDLFNCIKSACCALYCELVQKTGYNLLNRNHYEGNIRLS